MSSQDRIALVRSVVWRIKSLGRRQRLFLKLASFDRRGDDKFLRSVNTLNWPEQG